MRPSDIVRELTGFGIAANETRIYKQLFLAELQQCFKNKKIMNLLNNIVLDEFLQDFDKNASLRLSNKFLSQIIEGNKSLHLPRSNPIYSIKLLLLTGTILEEIEDFLEKRSGFNETKSTVRQGLDQILLLSNELCSVYFEIKGRTNPSVKPESEILFELIETNAYLFLTLFAKISEFIISLETVITPSILLCFSYLQICEKEVIHTAGIHLLNLITEGISDDEELLNQRSIMRESIADFIKTERLQQISKQQQTKERREQLISKFIHLCFKAFLEKENIVADNLAESLRVLRLPMVTLFIDYLGEEYLEFAKKPPSEFLGYIYTYCKSSFAPFYRLSCLIFIAGLLQSLMKKVGHSIPRYVPVQLQNLITTISKFTRIKGVPYMDRGKGKCCGCGYKQDKESYIKMIDPIENLCFVCTFCIDLSDNYAEDLSKDEYRIFSSLSLHLNNHVSEIISSIVLQSYKEAVPGRRRTFWKSFLHSMILFPYLGQHDVLLKHIAMRANDEDEEITLDTIECIPCLLKIKSKESTLTMQNILSLFMNRLGNLRDMKEKASEASIDSLIKSIDLHKKLKLDPLNMEQIEIFFKELRPNCFAYSQHRFHKKILLLVNKLASNAMESRGDIRSFLQVYFQFFSTVPMTLLRKITPTLKYHLVNIKNYPLSDFIRYIISSYKLDYTGYHMMLLVLFDDKLDLRKILGEEEFNSQGSRLADNLLDFIKNAQIPKDTDLVNSCFKLLRKCVALPFGKVESDLIIQYIFDEFWSFDPTLMKQVCKLGYALCVENREIDRINTLLKNAEKFVRLAITETSINSEAESLEVDMFYLEPLEAAITTIYNLIDILPQEAKVADFMNIVLEDIKSLMKINNPKFKYSLFRALYALTKSGHGSNILEEVIERTLEDKSPEDQVYASVALTLDIFAQEDKRSGKQKEIFKWLVSKWRSKIDYIEELSLSLNKLTQEASVRLVVFMAMEREMPMRGALILLHGLICSKEQDLADFAISKIKEIIEFEPRLKSESLGFLIINQMIKVFENSNLSLEDGLRRFWNFEAYLGIKEEDGVSSTIQKFFAKQDGFPYVDSDWNNPSQNLSMIRRVDLILLLSICTKTEVSKSDLCWLITHIARFIETSDASKGKVTAQNISSKYAREVIFLKCEKFLFYLSQEFVLSFHEYCREKKGRAQSYEMYVCDLAILQMIESEALTSKSSSKPSTNINYNLQLSLEKIGVLLSQFEAINDKLRLHLIKNETIHKSILSEDLIEFEEERSIFEIEYQDLLRIAQLNNLEKMREDERSRKRVSEKKLKMEETGSRMLVKKRTKAK